jgi:hypothetical protein
LFKRAAQFVTDKAIEKLFNSFNGTGSSGGGSTGGGVDWVSLFGSLFGGGKAAGGNVSAGMFYRVNENGPEMLSMGGNDFLMMGNQAGRVTPNKQSRGGSAITQIFQTLGLESRRTQERKAQISGREAQRALARNGT